eukprot:g11062.t1
MSGNLLQAPQAEDQDPTSEDRDLVMGKGTDFLVDYAYPVTAFKDDVWFPGCKSLFWKPNPDKPATGEAATALFQFLRDNIQWEQRNYNHDVAWYTVPEMKVKYGYGKNVYDPVAFPPWMYKLREQMMHTLRLPMDDPPHGCNINLYKNGSAQLGAHSDDEAIFDGIHSAIRIVSFSLGEARSFHILDKYKQFLKAIVLPPLSYMTMEGNFQRDLKHMVPAEPEKSQPRINITWRWVLKPDGAAADQQAALRSATKFGGKGMLSGKAHQQRHAGGGRGIYPQWNPNKGNSKNNYSSAGEHHRAGPYSSSQQMQKPILSGREHQQNRGAFHGHNDNRHSASSAALVSLTSTIQTSPASAQSCVDSGTASQCADFAKSFNCYDDMGAQCRALHGTTSTNPSSCVQLTGVKMTDLCCGTCASCGDFHWQCETEYSQHAGCNEDLGVVCRELLGPNDAATGCGQLNSRLVKLDCCRSCRLVEASDVPTLMRMECNADEALRKKYNADYAAGFNTLKNTNGCSEQALHDPLGHWPRLPVVCRQGLCSAWFATYAPGCSCFTDKRDTATALKERCSDTLWGASLYGGLDLGGQAELCANFAFVAGRVRETDLPMSNADEIFAVKKKLAGIFQVDTYTR